MVYDLQSKRGVVLKVMASGDSGERESYICRMKSFKSVQDISHLVVSLATFLLPENNEYNSH